MQTDLVLAIQPDLAQAVLLRDALLEQVDGEVVVVETTEAALSVIDKRVPKVILLHALMPVREEDYLAAYLRTLVNTGHVQVIAIPHLEPPSAPVPPKRSLFGALKLGKATRTRIRVGCDPRSFSADVAAYLAHADEITELNQYLRGYDESPGASERRGGYRWSPRDIPWVSSVRFTGVEKADLINVSSGGALVRTHSRPGLHSLTYGDSDSRARPRLTFQLASGAEVCATGQVIRFQAGLPNNGRVLYTVAFRFDESVSLEFKAMTLPAAAEVDEMRLVRVGLPQALRTRHIQELLNHPITLHNELLAGLLRAGMLPSSLRDTVSTLTTVNADLVTTKAKLRAARRTATSDADLLDLVRRLVPRLRELHAMRGAVIGSISREDFAMMAAQASRMRLLTVPARGIDSDNSRTSGI